MTGYANERFRGGGLGRDVAFIEEPFTGGQTASRVRELLAAINHDAVVELSPESGRVAHLLGCHDPEARPRRLIPFRDTRPARCPSANDSPGERPGRLHDYT